MCNECLVTASIYADFVLTIVAEEGRSRVVWSVSLAGAPPPRAQIHPRVCGTKNTTWWLECILAK